MPAAIVYSIVGLALSTLRGLKCYIEPMAKRSGASNQQTPSPNCLPEQIGAAHDPPSRTEDREPEGSRPQMPQEYERLISIVVSMRNLIQREASELAEANPQWDSAGMRD